MKGWWEKEAVNYIPYLTTFINIDGVSRIGETPSILINVVFAS
jgi:hypothetical protein